MSGSKRMRDLVGILKDKASIMKASLLLLSAKPATSFHLAVLRATTYHPTEPPPDYRMEEVLAQGHHHRPAAAALVDGILRRLHRTHNAFVALKCLLTLHHILRRGSLLLKAEFSHRRLNLTAFRDASDSETLELSKWVRWYAQVMEQSLVTSHFLGFYICSPPPPPRKEPNMNNSLRELNMLVGMIERICSSPESLHYQRMSMVYEVMKLVGEDYRFTLRQISRRIAEFGEGMEELRDEEVKELLHHLERVEDCKDKVLLMFLNKKNKDGTWDSIAHLRREAQDLQRRRHSVTLIPMPSGRRWLDVHWNPL